MPAKIEYCDESINPIRTKEGGWHCVKSSPGCKNCYAEKINRRFGDGKPYSKRDVELVLNKKALEKPLKWKKPKRIFIQDMSDLFLPVSGEYFNRVQHQAQCKIIDLIKETPQHTYIMLTKHPGEMSLSFMGAFGDGPDFWHEPLHFDNGKPLPNLWLGVTAENQEQADKRIPILLQIPAAVRFVSVEPMLGPVDLSNYLYRYFCVGCGWQGNNPHVEYIQQSAKRVPLYYCPACDTSIEGDGKTIEHPTLNWVICGGESGPGARPMHPDWPRKVRDDCVAAGVPYFFKQHGEYVQHANEAQVKAWNKQSVATFEGGNILLLKVGKKAAGRKLDGEIWNQMPETKEDKHEAV